MIRFNVIESRVPKVMATTKEFLVIFMMAVGATAIIGAIVYFLMSILTNGMDLM